MQLVCHSTPAADPLNSIPKTLIEDRTLLARFTAGDEDALAVVYQRHRPALQRQAARLLYASGHEPDDVLQDVFLRVHSALRGGVVPLEPRAWLLRLVHNACIDELRRARTRPVGDVELDGVPSIAALLPDELARRAEARALLGDINRLPERQRSVLVMSAIDGLSHEEVAGRLSTTVETTRSLLARARENLRRTALARETACGAVCDALDEASVAGVRASELARRHLWSCADCRSYQRGLRTAPSRLRRLASWSPWGLVAQLVGGGGLAGVQKVAVGACCALMVGGGAVAVPEIAVHARHVPQLVAVAPELPVPVKPVAERSKPRPKPAVSATTPVATAVWTPAPANATPAATPVAVKKKPRVRATAATFTRNEQRRLSFAMRMFLRTNPSAAERRAMNSHIRVLRAQPIGSRKRETALFKLTRAALGKARPLAPVRTGPPKGLPAPTPTPAPQAPTPTATPTQTPTATPTQTPAPAAPTT